MKVWLQKRILTISGTVLAALVIGKFVLAASGFGQPMRLIRLLCGLSVLSLLACIKLIGTALIKNIKASRITEEGFPESLQELRESGIENEIDFAYAMDQLLYYPSIGYLNNARGTSAPLLNRKLQRRGEEFFAEMFGREPEGAGSGDWKEIALRETAAKLGKEPEEVELEQVNAQISKKVSKYYYKLMKQRMEEILK